MRDRGLGCGVTQSHWHWLTEDTLLVGFGEAIDEAVNARVHAAAGALLAAGAAEVLPGFASLAVRGLAEAQVRAALETAGASLPEGTRLIEIPVCYAAELAPDLAEVAERSGLTQEEVIRRHTAPHYRVHALGFSPGFAYLAGLDPILALPRRGTPRTRVEAGSVGIGGGQTGVYPSATPGGWHLLGRTAVRLFRPECADDPTLLRPGDRVRFVPVTRGEFDRGSGGPPSESPALAGSIEVLRPGLQTTLQAGPRRGLRHLGYAAGGPMDPRSLAAANLLLGNAPDAPGLEATLLGPRLRFAEPALVAVAGADCAVTVDGEARAMGRVLAVGAGSVLDLGAVRRGCRIYLALGGGGFRAPSVLGSASTDLAGGFGGCGGRALRTGDRLAAAGNPPGRALSGALSASLRGWETGPSAIRVLAGPEAAAGLAGLLDVDWEVSGQSDRRGVRFCGTAGTRTIGTMISGPVLPGTIQLPPDGQPIVLGVDAQSLGGYPRIAQIIGADLSRLGQLAPGARVRFKVIGMDAARRALVDARRELGWLAAAARLAG